MRNKKILAWVLSCLVLASCVSTSRSDRAGNDKQLAEVNTQLGIEYMRAGMYQEALDKFQSAIKEDPNLQVAQTSLAVLYERLGEDETADKHYRKAYNMNRDDALLLNNYGQFLCRSGRLDEAEKMFAKASSDPLYGDPEVILTNAGLCEEKRPDPEAAEKFYRRALEKNPRYQPALRQMVRVSFGKQQYLASRAYLQRLQQVAPLPAEFLWIGVRTESELGNPNAASSYALLMKNRFPESEQTQALLEWERMQRGR